MALYFTPFTDLKHRIEEEIETHGGRAHFTFPPACLLAMINSNRSKSIAQEAVGLNYISVQMRGPLGLSTNPKESRQDGMRLHCAASPNIVLQILGSRHWFIPSLCRTLSVRPALQDALQVHMASVGTTKSKTQDLL